MLQFAHDQGKYQRYFNDIGSSFFGVFNDNVRSVVDVLKSNLKWAYDPQLAKYISSSSFSFRELRERKVSIYVVMPTTEAYEAKKTFLRLLVEAAIRECPPLTNEQKVNLSWGDRILFMLDEFTQLGKLEAINTGMQTCRHKGITLWCVFQDWNRLVKLYGEETAHSFLGAAGVIQAFNTNDLKTLELISKYCGKLLCENHTFTHSKQTL